MDKKRVRSLLGVVAFGVVLFVGLWHLGVVWAALRSVLATGSFFIVGLSIAFILATPLSWIENWLFAPLNKRLGKRWMKIRRPIAVVLTLLLIVLIVLLVVFMVIPEMSKTVELVAKEFPKFAQGVTTWVQQMAQEHGGAFESLQTLQIDWSKIGETLAKWLSDGASSLISGTFTAATSIVSAVVSFFLGLILSVYILLCKEKLSGQLTRVLYAFLPQKRVDSAVGVGRTASRIFGNFISGQFMECVILGALCFIGMTIFRFPFAPMVSVLVGITAVIPIFGAFIGVAVGAFMILVHRGFMTRVWFIVFFLVLQQIEGDVIYPHVVGKSVMLPGMWVLVAVTLGGNIAGIMGMVIGVPLCAVLYVLLREAVEKREAAKRKLQGD